MEISDELSGAESPENLFERDVMPVFQETLGLIHIALVSHYRLSRTGSDGAREGSLRLVPPLLLSPWCVSEREPALPAGRVLSVRA